MAQAIVLREPGNATVLRLENVPVGAPGPGELRVRQNAIGVNFHDIYVRSGLYKTLNARVQLSRMPMSKPSSTSCVSAPMMRDSRMLPTRS